MVKAAVLDEDLETISKSLFGNRHMLHVGRQIASTPSAFTVSQVASQTGVPYSTAHRLVTQLQAVGLLKQVPAGVDDPSHWFKREAHKFWGAVQQLCKSTVRVEEPTDA